MTLKDAVGEYGVIPPLDSDRREDSYYSYYPDRVWKNNSIDVNTDQAMHSAIKNVLLDAALVLQSDQMYSTLPNAVLSYSHEPSELLTLAHKKWEEVSRRAYATWARPPVEGESLRHREAAAVMDRYARGLLWQISDCTFIPGPEVMEFADDYDGLRAVLRVVRAGWATAGPDGLIVTDHGRDVAKRMFTDR